MKTNRDAQGGCRKSWAVALAALAALSCGGPNGEAGSDDGLASGSEALTKNPACRSAELAARREYAPTAFRDDTVTFDPPMSFTVPSDLRVTRGNGGNSEAVLDIEPLRGMPIRCNYRGGAEAEHPRGRDDQERGRRYVLDDCAPGRSLRAGSTVQAVRVTLHVVNGDHKAGTTEVRVTLEETEPCAGDLCQGVTAAAEDDHNACTVDGCDPLTGITHTPAASGTACSDGNACNGLEACDGAGTCASGPAPAIDDGNPCTADSCDPVSGVQHTPLANGASCTDGDVCNGDELCDGAGHCQRGSAPVVDDLNPCTADACDPVLGVAHTFLGAGASCADGDRCNGDETCDGAGRCLAGAAPVVDDRNPCTADACDPATGVSHVALASGTSCSDQDACNGEESCDGAGACVRGPAPVVDDGNPCTADSCTAAGGVSHVALAAGASCSDGNACNGAETCNGSGSCLAGAAPVVDDGNPCTADACDPASGVSHVALAAGTSCSDGNACNGAETCNGSGSCLPGTAPVVNDGNPCTADSCDPASGVSHTALAAGTSCSDGDACNGAEACDGAGACVRGPAPQVDDGNPCTADSCSAAGGVAHTALAAGASCSDGNACNGAETCNGAGSCQAGSAPVVDDGNPCTADSCDPATGVSHVALAAGTSCSDGNLCNGLELCNGAGSCVGGAAPEVNDNNPCTADSCDPLLGVSHVPAAAGSSCSDGNACNGAETCDGSGRCLAGTAPVVDDGNRCTADSCDPLTGVSHTALAAGTSCSDGNACNGAETCDGSGSCLAGTAPVVDDKNACTADSCDPVLGVVHTPLASGTSCSDGNACNGAETCNGSGTCVAGTAPVVDDKNPCTADSCDPVLGVTHTPVAVGTICSSPSSPCDPVLACGSTGKCDMVAVPPAPFCPPK